MVPARVCAAGLATRSIGRGTGQLTRTVLPQANAYVKTIPAPLSSH
jgi:hypothetical protein